jgi:thioesterase domain-containing protein
MPPLFCIVTPGGNPLGYEALQRHLNPDQPIYLVQATFPGQRPARLRLSREEYETFSVDCLRAIDQAWPNGPFLLTGMCEGAHIAFEIARKIESRGQAVALLAVIDTWQVEHSYDPRMLTVRLKVLALQQFLRDDWHAKLKKLTGVPSRLARRLSSMVSRVPERGQPDVWAQRVWPGGDWRPTTMKGQIDVLTVRRQPYYRPRDSYLGWKDRSEQGVVLVPIPGKHNTILREPHIRSLCRILEDRIDAALTRSRAGAVGESADDIPALDYCRAAESPGCSSTTSAISGR